MRSLRSPSILLSFLLCSAPVFAADPYPAPTSPDALVENLVRSLDEMDYDEYERLLDWSYLFDFAPEHEWIAPEGWTIDEELEAMRNMLSGRPSSWDPDAPYVIDIEARLDPMGPWEETHEDPLGFFRTWRRDYAGRITVEFSDGSTARVHRREVLTVMSLLSEATLEATEFRLLRWEEEEALGRFQSMKARF